jgi:holo-[acyl-carrier protein] synthase
MIVGIGIDLVSISKMAERIEKPGFIEKVFTEEEIKYCSAHAKSAERYAGRFAAKEAFMKAIGRGIKQEVWFSQIEIRNRASGAPQLYCHGKADEALKYLEVAKIHLSISHTQDTAVAIVILEDQKE